VILKPKSSIPTELASESSLSRTAILPTPGDPLLLRFWLENFKQVWMTEVDQLIVSVNSGVEPYVAAYIKKLITETPKTFMIYRSRQTDHGDAINEALDFANDLVFLIEDDAFILTGGQVHGCFSVLERDEKDMIVSPRGSCAQAIWDAVRDHWGLLHAPNGEIGPNFWPNFWFGKRDDLTATDRKFCSRGWVRGERIEPLGMVAHELMNGDTFVSTSLQLRAKQPRIATVPQYHGHPEDLDNRAAGRGLWDGKAPWIHIGSLSSGVSGVITDEFGRPLSRKNDVAKQDPGWSLPPYVNTEMERMEWERRVAWWMMALQSADRDESNPIPEFREEYRAGLDRIISQFGLSLGRILRTIKAYEELITWKI
jgi:hypothetical protein